MEAAAIWTTAKQPMTKEVKLPRNQLAMTVSQAQ